MGSPGDVSWLTSTPHRAHRPTVTWDSRLGAVGRRPVRGAGDPRSVSVHEAGALRTFGDVRAGSVAPSAMGTVSADRDSISIDLCRLGSLRLRKKWLFLARSAMTGPDDAGLPVDVFRS